MAEALPANPLRFGGEEAEPLPYARARVAVLPAPYEGTVSYGTGAAQGPAAILRASAQLEMYDEELDCRPDRSRHFHPARGGACWPGP